MNFHISAAQLQAVLRAMRHKSHGPDHWTAEALLLLPFAWWERIADLWQRVIEVGCPPRAWSWGRSSPIWKPSGATRPITVLPFVRMGAKIINQQLAEWCSSWCSRHDAGGITGTSTGKALQQFRRCIDKGSNVAVQQDVAGFFDSLDPAHVTLVLQHLRAPEPLVNLIRSTCQHSSRLFALQGALGSDWRSPGRGLPQGCPLSPTVAAAISHVWTAYTLQIATQVPQQIDGYAYVDDRCIMLCPNSPLEALKRALSRSDQFDAAFGLQLSLEVRSCLTCS